MKSSRTLSLQRQESILAEGNQESANRLLAALPYQEYQLFAQHLQDVSLRRGQVLYRWGEPIANVYFPCQGIVSLISTVESGATAEVGLIGKEGMIGLPLFLGSDLARESAVVQVPGSAVKLNATAFKAQLNQATHLQKFLLLFTQMFLTQISQTVIYSSLYPVQARFARWLLLVQDLTQLDRIPLTQEHISLMLGVRRATVTSAAVSLSEAGSIAYTRGRITILNRQVLESQAGDTYSFFKRELEQFFGACPEPKFPQ